MKWLKTVLKLHIEKKFGNIKIVNTKFTSLFERYIFRHLSNHVSHIRPLNFIEYNLDSAINELELARKVYAAGIPTPKPGEFVTDGNGRFGIQFERIVGKKSYSRATGDDPQNVEKYAREFAKMCKELHSIHLKKGDFEDQKEKDKRQIDENPYFTPEEKVKVKAFVDENFDDKIVVEVTDNGRGIPTDINQKAGKKQDSYSN